MRPIPSLLILVASLHFLPAALGGEDGFTPIFNGKDLSGWTSRTGEQPGSGWVIEDGCIHRQDRGGDLFSAKEYGDFDFRFEWKISPAGNSGVKYRTMEYPKKGLLGPEYQVLDDDNHPDAKVTNKRQAAALYDILATPEDKAIRPVGEWNEGRIVAKGHHLEHWLNGQKTIDVDVGSDRWKELVGASKFKGVPGFAENASGRLMLQDHGNKVWFRNLRIKEL